jgi:hypothetical protein
MNRAEWALYESVAAVPPTIGGEEFEPPTQEQGMRLLCRGYHVNGGPNVRVWLRFDGEIGVQHDDRDIVFKKRWGTGALYPSKRVYREDTDLLFATLMRERHDYALNFTTWRD